jgi:MscS family membrane protein
VNGFTGTIEKIGLRSTRIRTQEKTYISVPNKLMVDSIVDNISLRSERKIEMDLQLSVTTSASALADFANHMRAILKSENNLNSYHVFIAESGKQYHALHIECLVNMQMDIETFQMIRERLNLATIEYANTHQIQFSEKG